ncbi:division/cell wall cluster transcriptional repressor MraZ [Aquihabitans sp. McL0605]|uniref:division/cell wall cluster transcriptional repressor MraZ n=1 Tax=Aquihabitans sp. McL0605 TaxID=3415671 RepID=UPI003CFA7FE8
MAAGGEARIAGEAAGALLEPRPPVFGHHPFSGTYRTRLEASGRLALPSAFKFAFTDAALVRAHRTEHLMLWTPRGFEAVVDAMQASQPGGLLDPKTRLRIFKSAPRISVDRQSRLVLPPELREQVGLTGEVEVVLAGAVEAIEIWPARRFDDEEGPKLDDVDLLFDTHSGLPTGPA